MKKLFAVLVAMLVLPMAIATGVGTGITPDITTEDFAPLVWLCDNRIVYDDSTEPGRWDCSGWDYEDHELNHELDPNRDGLCERLNNYAFEGEQIQWKVLVMDKNGIEKIEDVFVTIGTSQGAGNDIEVNCDFWEVAYEVYESCNARILEEEIDSFTPEALSEVAAYWKCTLTVETPESMYGEYWVTVEATDLDGLSGTMDENEYWFLNPVIALSIDGDMTFEDVRPGTSSYSDTLLIQNDADAGSGVMMDMFISGTDFYDSSSSGAMCPYTNQLLLGDGDSDCDLGTDFGGYDSFTDPFCYYAVNGAYSTYQDPRDDVEGYVGIDYGIGFHNPENFYGNNEIMQVAGPLGPTGYFAANVLAPGAEMAMTFRLNLPEPCNGDFDTGAIYFWGEAI